jgi:hypothetical protein
MTQFMFIKPVSAMKKLLFTCLLPLLTITIYAQSLTLAEFESFITAKSLKEKSELLTAKGFIKRDKEGSKTSEPVMFAKGLYMTENIPTTAELVFLSADIASYVVKDPQYYAAFIKQVEAKYKKNKHQMPGRHGKQTTYSLKTTDIMVEETIEKIGDTETTLTVWYFTIVKL